MAPVTKTNQLPFALDKDLSSEIMSGVLNSALDAVIITDEQGIIREWNEQAASIFGWKKSQVLGRNFAETVFTERLQALYKNGFKKFLSTGDTDSITKRIEITALNCRGNEFPIEFTMIPHTVNGNYFFSAFIRDLSKAKETEKTLSTIHDLAISLIGKNDLEEIGWEITRNVNNSLKLEDCVVYVRDDNDNKLHQVAAYGPKNPRGREIKNKISLHIDEGIVGKAASYKQTILINDTSTFPGYVPDNGIRLSELAVPIMYAGEVIGVIDSEHSEKNFYKKHHIEAFTTIASMCSSALKSAINIKKRDAMAQSLRESEERWQSLVENMPEALQLSKEGKIIYINPAGMNLYEADEFTDIYGYDIFKLAENIKPEVFQQRLSKLRNHEEIGSLEFQVRTLKGNKKFIEVNSTPVVLGGDEVIQTVFRDITDKRKSENELRNLSSQLHSILDNLNFGVLMEDSNRSIVHVNKQFSELFGNTFSPDDMYGKVCTEIIGRAKDIFKDPKTFTNSTNSIVQRREPVINEELELNDGRILSRDFIPIDYDGENLGIVWQYRDVTEIKKTEQNLIQALEKERNYNDLSRNFVSMASHEFRTPLTSIHSTVELLLKFGDRFSAEDKIKRLERIFNSSIRMNKLIENVLTIGKLDSGNSEINATQFCFEDTLNDVVQLLKANKLNHRTIEFSNDCDRDCQINSDVSLVELILRNLLENAAKYSDEGTPIHINYGFRGANFEFVCRDFGIGIPEFDLDTIFESFKRASNIGDRKGTGLGLSIVQKAVNRLQGVITVESTLNEGTTVRVKLPATMVQNNSPI